MIFNEPHHSTPSRRTVLKAGAAAAGASLLPPSLLQQIAHSAPAGSLDDLEHVIFLMQENRAFDHYFGSLRGVQGFGDDNALRQREGDRNVFAQKADGDETVLPFSIRQAAGRQSMNGENVDALNHDWDGGTAALNDGWCDNWIPAKTAATMAYYDRKDLPFQYELADTFTVCDQYFCSAPTSTSPNRNFFFSGTTGHEPLSPAERALDNRAYDDGHPGYDWPCLAEVLDEAGIDWRVYQEYDNYTDNNLEYFRYTKDVARKVFPAKYKHSAEEYYSALADGEKAPDLDLSKLTDHERHIFDRALYRSEPGTLTDRVARDIGKDALPTVSWLVASADECEHPSASSPRASANFIYRLLDALGNNPDVWKKTALIITFDENDGYFDHVVPPRPPRAEKDERYRGTPVGLGNRVPTTIISPWTVGGYRCSEVFDHTSAAQFLEAWKGISVPTISAWRRRICGDLTSAFDFQQPKSYSPVGRPQPADPLEPRWKPEPPAADAAGMPEQEPGERPQRPLPYDLSAAVIPRTGGVDIILRNDGPAAANMLIYPFHAPKDDVMAYDVQGEERIALDIDGDYDFTILGPAGFRIDAAGSAFKSATKYG